MKKGNKLAVIIHILLGVLAIASVPASVFWIQVPNFITVVFCVILAASFIYCLKAVAKKRACRIGLGIFTFLAMVLAVVGNYCNPYWNSIWMKDNVSCYSQRIDDVLTQKEAKEDLHYAMYYLKKLHPAFYRGIPEEINNRYEEVVAEIDDAETISVYEFNRKIESIFSILRDGHSFAKANAETPHYMKDIYRFNQDNYTLVSINGIELADLLQEKKDLYSFEVESWQLRLLKSDISSLEGLKYLGFATEDGIDYTYEAEDGTRETHTYYEEDFITYDEYAAYNKIDQGEKDTKSFVSYEIDEEDSLAVLTLDSCDYNEEYKACLKEMFEQVKEKQIENVAVDLRNNGGGSSLVADEFIRYLDVESYNQGRNVWRWGCFKIASGSGLMENKKYDDFLFEGDVYILTSANSFSSAMLFAEYITDNDLGTLIGEAPGNTPSGYGECSVFKLPNSQICMQVSTKEFFRADSSNPSNLVEPDIACDSDQATEVLKSHIRSEK